jgi:hypothetical protein
MPCCCDGSMPCIAHAAVGQVSAPLRHGASVSPCTSTLASPRKRTSPPPSRASATGPRHWVTGVPRPHRHYLVWHTVARRCHHHKELHVSLLPRHPHGAAEPCEAPFARIFLHARSSGLSACPQDARGDILCVPGTRMSILRVPWMDDGWMSILDVTVTHDPAASYRSAVAVTDGAAATHQLAEKKSFGARELR